MKRFSRLVRRVMPALLVLAAALTTAAPVAGQVGEVEPNNTCITAQDAGAVSLPFSMNGSLDTPPATPDVDFFRFTVTPSTTVQVDLEGQATGKGTLPDPLVGVFSSSCASLAVDDNSGSPPNARALVTVPADGVLVVAATSCCDYAFTGDGFSSGSYALTLGSVASAASISGRVIDATTGQPLPGSSPPFTFVELHRCSISDCFETVAVQPTDDLGQFRFESSPLLVLPAGTYQLFISAGQTYQSLQTPPFDVAEGQSYDAGDIGLTPVPVAGAISGRVVDAATGAPLRGDGPPFVVVRLQQCDPFFGCFDVVAVPTDSQGRFRFAPDTIGFPLPVGIYQLAIAADQYPERVIGPFTADANQDIDFGDIALASYGVRFSEIRPCGNLPPEGGPCEYSFRITNSMSTTLSGLVWSLVGTSGTTAISQTTLFQPGPPAWYVLAPGASQVVRFSFTVPSSVSDGTTICALALASQGDSFFNIAGQRNLFCIVKGYTGFRLLSEKEAHARMRQPPYAARRMPAAQR